MRGVCEKDSNDVVATTNAAVAAARKTSSGYGSIGVGVDEEMEGVDGDVDDSPPIYFTAEPREDDEEEEAGHSSEVVDDTPLHERHGLTLESMKALAEEAGKVGVMQATPSTVQGQTGWYVDVSEELQYWEVTPDGEWIRHE